MKIWKFPVEPSERPLVWMQEGAKILHFGLQGNTPCLWALCDSDAPKEGREFRQFGTGHDIPDEVGEYIGTVLMNNGTLVLHLFEDAAS